MSCSSLHRSIVTVYVSPDQYPFHFHKGRLCQHSSFFEKAFHGSFEEATTGSMYLEGDGVDEFKLFEEWLCSGNLSYPKDSDDPSLLLVKVFCFADKVGISPLQNATLDTIRDRATRQDASSANSNTMETKPQNGFGFAQTTWNFELHQSSTTTDKRAAKFLSPATSTAIHYAYQNTSDSSPLRKMLADIFAFNVKPETLDESLLMLPAEFMADVLFINMKRLPLRLGDEKADFDLNADKYHVKDTSYDRRSRAVAMEAAVDNEDDTGEAFGTWGFSSGKGKKKGKKSR